MKYEVISDRLTWPAGTIVDADQLAGSSIAVLTAGGHLAPVDDTPETEPEPKPKTRRKADKEEL